METNWHCCCIVISTTGTSLQRIGVPVFQGRGCKLKLLECLTIRKSSVLIYSSCTPGTTCAGYVFYVSSIPGIALRRWLVFMVGVRPWRDRTAVLQILSHVPVRDTV